MNVTRIAGARAIDAKLRQILSNRTISQNRWLSWTVRGAETLRLADSPELFHLSRLVITLLYRSGGSSAMAFPGQGASVFHRRKAYHLCCFRVGIDPS